jgi:hypothetical protein
VSARNGQAIGGATTTYEAKFGRALTLTRNADPTTGQFVTVPYSTSYDFGTSNFSYGGWVKLLGGANASMTLFGNVSSGAGTGFSMELSSGGVVRARLNMNGLSNVATTTTMLDDGQWHHVLATVNRTTNITTVYVDGVVGDTNDISAMAGFSINTGGNAFTLGARTSSTPNPMNGLLDDVAIWNRVLTAAEVTQVYNGQPY